MQRWIRGTTGSDLEGFGLRRARNGKDDEPTTALIEEAPVFSADVLSLRYSPHDWRTIWGAAALGQTRILNYMLQRGENIDRCDAEGRTALHYATDFRQVPALCLLLEHNADPNATDFQGKTPLFFVREPLAETLLTILVNGGADLNQTDANGHSPLFLARAKANRRLSILLERTGATTGFLEAAVMGDVEKARTLPLAGAVDALLPDGGTLLIRAIKKGDFALTALLLNRGADPNLPDRTGRTPLDAAASDSRGRILRLLLDAGATFSTRDYPDPETLQRWAGIKGMPSEEDYSSS